MNFKDGDLTSGTLATLVGSVQFSTNSIFLKREGIPGGNRRLHEPPAGQHGGVYGRKLHRKPVTGWTIFADCKYDLSRPYTYRISCVIRPFLSHKKK